METRFYQQYQQKKIPRGQNWFISKLISLIQFANEKEKKDFVDGWCFGLSLMWAQACLSKDLETFNRRLHIINQFSSAKEMQDAIERVKVKKISIDKAKKANQPFQELTTDEEIIFSIPIFLNGLILQQHLHSYKELFPEEGKSKISAQNAMVSMKLTLPLALEAKKDEQEKGVHLFLPVKKANPFDTYKMNFSYSFTGLYSNSELIEYFKSLRGMLLEPPVEYPVVIRLGTLEHSIIIGFDDQTRKWQFTDANRLPTKDVDSSEDLVSLIQKAETFCSNDGKKMTCFASSVFVAGENKDDLDSRMYKWMESEEWKKIHEETTEKATYFASSENQIDWLRLAIRRHDSQRAIKIIEAANDLTKEDSNRGLDILSLATSEGLIEVVKALLKKGIKPDKLNGDKSTAMHEAVEGGHLDILKLFVDEYEADTSVTNKYSETILYKAAEYGRYDIAKYIIDNELTHDEDDNINLSDAIHEAIKKKHGDIVDLLLTYEMQMKPSVDSDDEWSASESLESDLSDEETPDDKEPTSDKESDEEASDDEEASSEKEFSADEESDSDLESESSSEENVTTYLHTAARSGNLSIFELVQEYGFDTNALDEDENTALHLAAKKGHLSIVSKLLDEFDADADAVNENNETPLQLAAKKSRLDIVKKLSDHGISDINAQNDDDNTALHLSILADEPDINLVKFLLEKGAKPDLKNDDGQTPLHLAVIAGNVAMAELILDKGADPNLRNEVGQTPLHLAARAGNRDMVKLLLRKQADPLLTDIEERTPAQLAINRNHDEVAMLLPRPKKRAQVPSLFAADQQRALLPLSEQEILKKSEFDYPTFNTLINELEQLREKRLNPKIGLSPTELVRYNLLHKKFDLSVDANDARTKQRYGKMLLAIKYQLSHKEQRGISGPSGLRLLEVECMKLTNDLLNTNLNTIPGRIKTSYQIYLSDAGFQVALEEMKKALAVKQMEMAPSSPAKAPSPFQKGEV